MSSSMQHSWFFSFISFRITMWIFIFAGFSMWFLVFFQTPIWPWHLILYAFSSWFWTFFIHCHFVTFWSARFYISLFSFLDWVFAFCRWRLFDVLEFCQRWPDFAGRRHLGWSRFDVWMVHGNLWKNGRTRRFPGWSCLCLTLFESTTRRHPGKKLKNKNFPSLITLDNAENYLMISLLSAGEVERKCKNDFAGNRKKFSSVFRRTLWVWNAKIV